MTAKDEYQCLIRHFFPKLRVLIVLIDDEFDIGEVWKPRDEYQSYEDARLDDDDYTLYEDKKYVLKRLTLACTGLFRDVAKSKQYAYHIKDEMEYAFKNEEESWGDYIAPGLVVKGCSLQLDSDYLRDCDRRPDGYRSPAEDGSDAAEESGDESDFDSDPDAAFGLSSDEDSGDFPMHTGKLEFVRPQLLAHRARVQNYTSSVPSRPKPSIRQNQQLSTQRVARQQKHGSGKASREVFDQQPQQKQQKQPLSEEQRERRREKKSRGQRANRKARRQQRVEQ